MTNYCNVVAILCGMCSLGWAERIAGQTYHRLEQPIVLTASPTACQSPARISQRPVVQYTYGDRYMSPSVVESLPSSVAASEMVPLPAGPARRTLSSGPIMPVTAYAVPAPTPVPAPTLMPVPAAAPVQLYRPVTGPPVPEGYILGEGLIGQPKLFKPGEPIRNLLRYISL